MNGSALLAIGGTVAVMLLISRRQVRTVATPFSRYSDPFAAANRTDTPTGGNVGTGRVISDRPSTGLNGMGYMPRGGRQRALASVHHRRFAGSVTPAPLPVPTWPDPAPRPVPGWSGSGPAPSDRSANAARLQHVLNMRGGLSGLGANAPSYSVSPNANIASEFSQGQPGTYLVTMRVQNVPLSEPATTFLDPGPFNTAIKGAVGAARVTQVRYLRNENVRDANWAASAITDLFGNSGTTGAISDRIFEVTVTVTGPAPAAESVYLPDPTMSGMGAVQIGAGAALIVLAAIAVVLAVTFNGAHKVVLEAVRFLGEAIGEFAGGIGDGLTKNWMPILIGVGVVAGAIFLLKKGGASFKGKGFSF